MSGSDMSLFCEGGNVQYAPITRREWEIVQLVARGLTTVEIAQRLALHPKTVNNHVWAVLSVFGVSTRLQLVLLLLRYGLLDGDQSYEALVARIQASWSQAP
jgi:DNA-binding NarL/FixJ family response regulator